MSAHSLTDEWKTQGQILRQLGVDYAGDLKVVMRRLADQHNTGKATSLADGTAIRTRAAKIDGVNKLVIHEDCVPMMERAVLAIARDRQDDEIMAFATAEERSRPMGYGASL